MAAYRVRIRFANGKRLAFTGIFSNGCEAVLHAMAEWSDLEIRTIAALYIGGQS